ncbi:unnamed protein product, partial [Penicillium egyptiacum]
ADTSETTPLTSTVPDTFTALRAEIDHERLAASEHNDTDLGIRTVGEWSLGADEELIHPPAETESPPGPEQPWEARSTEP